MIMPQATFCETNEIHFIHSHLSIETKYNGVSSKQLHIILNFQAKKTYFETKRLQKVAKFNSVFLKEFNYQQLIVIESN